MNGSDTRTCRELDHWGTMSMEPSMGVCLRVAALLSGSVLAASAQAGAPLPITWVGGAGGSYCNALNWDPQIVPCNAGLFEYAALLSGSSVIFDCASPCEVTELTLPAGTTLTGQIGSNMTVLETALIGGVVVLNDGIFTAIGPGTAFTSTVVQIFASNTPGNAAAVTICGPTTYSSTGLTGGGTIFSANGDATTVNLSCLTDLNAGYNSPSGFTQVQTITAAGGGLVDLSGVQTITAPVDIEDRLDITMSDAASMIDLSGLETLTSASQGGVRFDLSNGATVSLPSVTSLHQVSFFLDTQAGLIADVMPAAYSTTGWTGGGTIISVLDAGTILDLSGVVTLNAGYNSPSGFTQVQTITAAGGGLVDLSGVQTITAPVDNEDRLDIVVGSGSIIKLGLDDGVSLQSAGAGDIRISISTDGVIQTGTLQASAGTTVIFVDGSGVLDVDGSLLLASTIRFSAATGGTIAVSGPCLTFTHTDENAIPLGDVDVRFDGQGAQRLEVGGSDVGPQALPNDNFGFGQLVVGQDAQVTTLRLTDALDNGNRLGGNPEALYLYGANGENGLRILGDSTLLIPADINLYAFDTVVMNLVHINAGLTLGDPPTTFDTGFVQLVQPCAVGDIDCDGQVGIVDFLAVLAAWGPCPAPPAECPADVVCDGEVDIQDFLLVLANWG